MCKLSLSIVEILSKDDFNIIIPSHFLDEIRKEGWTHLLLLLDPNTKKVNLIPTYSNRVHKITFFLDDLTTQSLKAFSKIILKYNIGTLYTSGLAYINKNIFESFVDTSQYNENQIYELIEECTKIPGVIEVKIEPIPLENLKLCK